MRNIKGIYSMDFRLKNSKIASKKDFNRVKFIMWILFIFDLSLIFTNFFVIEPTFVSTIIISFITFALMPNPRTLFQSYDNYLTTTKHND